MSLRVIGAGCGRTGTASLKFALERLLGAPCYHMIEVFQHPEHSAIWRRAALGETVDWDALMARYVAAVDWPSSAFWPELMGAWPDGLVLLSIRDADEWWASASQTIFPSIQTHPRAPQEWKEMIADLFRERWGAALDDREASIAAYNAHNARVLSTVPKERLLVWRTGEGWEPICRALGVPVPAEPFPRANTREEFLARAKAYAAQETTAQ
ncbi:MAG TPA: sulfotransferase [Rhizomicrobium sp.]|jgi:hypothetical protein